jgi:hypothetical protein
MAVHGRERLDVLLLPIDEAFRLEKSQLYMRPPALLGPYAPANCHHSRKCKMN